MNTRRPFVAVIAALSLAALTASAQEPSPTRGVVRKGKVPVSGEILKIKLPHVSEATLPNGLHLIVLEDRRLPQIAFQLVIPGAGGYFDPAEQPGLASFTASLMREGTASRKSNQISEQLELMAATLNFGAGSSPEATVTGSCLSDQAIRLLDLAADVLLHPAFPEEEIAPLQAANPRRARPAASEPRSARGGSILSRRVRLASGSADLADPGVARAIDARGSRGVPSRPLPARSRRPRHRRRRVHAAGPGRRRVEAWRVDEADRFGDHQRPRPDASQRVEDLLRRSDHTRCRRTSSSVPRRSSAPAATTT